METKRMKEIFCIAVLGAAAAFCAYLGEALEEEIDKQTTINPGLRELRDMGVRFENEE